MEFSDIEILRSSRRSIRIEITPSGHLRVRAPLRASNERIRQCLVQNEQWILRNLAKAQKAIAARPVVQPLSEAELTQLKQQAAEVFARRAAYYAPLVGVSYGRVTVRAQRTRWGSCSAHGNLSFNCLLLLAPQEVLDSVVVHELCHRRFMNHSADFYRLVLQVMPDYRRHHAWLKANGAALLQRLPQQE